MNHNEAFLNNESDKKFLWKTFSDKHNYCISAWPGKLFFMYSSYAVHRVILSSIFIYIFLQLFETKRLSDLRTGGFVNNARPIANPQIHRDARSSTRHSTFAFEQYINSEGDKSACAALSTDMSHSFFCYLPVRWIIATGLFIYRSLNSLWREASGRWGKTDRRIDSDSAGESYISTSALGWWESKAWERRGRWEWVNYTISEFKHFCR